MMGAKEYLEQVKLFDVRVQNYLEELERLNALVTKVTSTWKGDVVSGGGNQDKLGYVVAKIVDLKHEVNKAIDDYIDKQKEIGTILDKIADPDQLRVLYKRYFDGLTWEQIACDMHMSYRNVCYIHGRALQTVGKLLGEKQ